MASGGGGSGGGSGSSSGGGGIGAAGMVMSAIGAVGDAYGSYIQGQMQKATMDFNSAVSQKQAEITRKSGAINAYKKKQAIAEALGEQQTAYAASGVVATAGSAIDVMISSLSNAYLDLQIDAFNTEVTARGLQASAGAENMKGYMYGAAGTAKAMSSIASTSSDYAMKMMSRSDTSSKQMIADRNATFPEAEG